jgi:hypothetical protein
VGVARIRVASASHIGSKHRVIPPISRARVESGHAATALPILARDAATRSHSLDAAKSIRDVTRSLLLNRWNISCPASRPSCIISILQGPVSGYESRFEHWRQVVSGDQIMEALATRPVARRASDQGSVVTPMACLGNSASRPARPPPITTNSQPTTLPSSSRQLSASGSEFMSPRAGSAADSFIG